MVFSYHHPNIQNNCDSSFAIISQSLRHAAKLSLRSVIAFSLLAVAATGLYSRRSRRSLCCNVWVKLNRQRNTVFVFGKSFRTTTFCSLSFQMRQGSLRQRSASRQIVAQSITVRTQSQIMSRIVYSPKYNIGFYGLEKLHPFDSRKYGRAWKLLHERLGPRLREMHIRPRRQANWNELLRVHSGEYLLKLKKPSYVAKALELPPLQRLPGWMIDWHVLRPMRWATRGTIIAAEQALEHGLAINLSGGYHHASPKRGEGFSIYADVGVAVASMRASGLLNKDSRIICVDTDAHQGNGVCHTFMDDQQAFIFDIFNSQIYPTDPQARHRIDCEIPIDCSCTDHQYMHLLETRLPGFLDSVAKSEVGIAFYNAGTDVFAGDPLGHLNISAELILRRDLYVVSELRKREIPTVMVLSGGYTKESFRLVANSVTRLLE